MIPSIYFEKDTNQLIKNAGSWNTILRFYKLKMPMQNLTYIKGNINTNSSEKSN